jgi:predicted DCC family thiol-disulfide oxidoreductase YuxK
MKYHLPIILFDPDCPLCLRFKQGLEFLDKNLNFVSVQDDEIYSEFPELQRQECLEKVHLITVDRKILKGIEVVDFLAESLPAVSKFSWLLESEQGKKAKEFFYQKVEELREITKKKNEGNCQQCPHDKN